MAILGLRMRRASGIVRLCTSPFSILALLLLLGFLLAPNLKIALMLPLLVIFLSLVVASLAYADIPFLYHTALAKRLAASLLVLVHAIA